MKEIQYKDIAEYTGKSINTIKGWKVKFPALLELVKLGAFCKKNNITMEMIKSCIEIKKMATQQEETNK